MTTQEHTIHKFEEAGLGKAPFRVVGVEILRGPLPILDPKTGQHTGGYSGSPGQPMGCCRYCYTGIAECWWVESADGKRFMVGNVCVGKTGDRGLKKQMAPLKRELSHKRDDARIATAQAALQDEAIRAAVQAEDSPNPWRAEKGESLLDHVEWMFEHAGRPGRFAPPARSRPSPRLSASRSTRGTRDERPV